MSSRYCRWRSAAAAGQTEQQVVADFDADPRQPACRWARRSAHVDAAQPVARCRGRRRPSSRRRAAGSSRRLSRRVPEAPANGPCARGLNHHIDDPLRDDDDLFRALAVRAPFVPHRGPDGSLDLGSFPASRATVTSARFLPLICTGSVMVVSTSNSGSICGQASAETSVRGRARPSIPRPGAASSGGTGGPGCRRPRALPRRSRAPAPFSALPMASPSALANS